MNQVNKIPLSATAVFLLSISVAWATADGPDFYQVSGVAFDDVLNIRAEPRGKARIVGNIPPNGQCIRNLGCRGGLSFDEFTRLSEAEKKKRLKQNPRWCKIEYQGRTGWVAGHYLAEGYCQSSRADHAGDPDALLKAKLLEIPGLVSEKTRYFSALADLNGDGRPETIALIAGPMVCGTGGCNTYVFTPENGGLRLVTEISVTRPPIRSASTTTKGWRDIFVYTAGGGNPSAGYARLKFDGKSYPSNPTVPPAENAGKNVDADIVIEPFQSFTEGKLLK